MNYDISKATELEWLKANSVNGTPEGMDTADKEFKRTWCSVKLLDSVLEGDYKGFSACQPEETRITRESFDEIRTYVKSVLTTADDEDAMRAFLVINDLGKVSDFVQKIADSMGFESVDHDKILYEGLKAHPEFSPTFYALSEKYQKTILTGLKTAFNMGQYVQCECLPKNLEPLTEIDAESLNYYMIHVLFDIAGAAGHINSNGSLICNELYWKKFSWALESIISMVSGKYGPEDAYNAYLTKTMEYYSVSSRVIAKLCNLVRVSTPEEAEEIKEAFYSLQTATRDNLENELMATGVGESTAILMYYAPATFQNALKYYKKIDSKTAIYKTIQKIAPLMSCIYNRIRSMEEHSDGVTIAFIADIAKKAMEPEKLTNSFDIKRVGNDFVVTECNSDASQHFGLCEQKEQKEKKMIINYSDQPVRIAEKSIFLAGPTPRRKETSSWRPDACRYLQELGFDGIVYVPELSNGTVKFNYDNQITWEWEALEKASIIVFWIPRNLTDMPAFTTNVEFGYYVRDSRVVYGRPDTAELNRYLDSLYKRHHSESEIYNDLQTLCKYTVQLLTKDAK